MEAEGVESIMRERVEAAEKLLNRNSELLKRGLSSKLSVTIAEQGLIERRSGLLKATNDRLQAGESLLSFVYGTNYSVHLRKGIPSIKTIPVKPREVPTASDEKAIESAMETRKDLFALKASLNASKIKNSNLKNNLLPDLNLTVSGTKGGAPGYSANNSNNSSVFAGLSVSFPLGNDSAEGSFHQSTATLDRDEFLMREGSERVRQEVYSSFRAISFAQARLKNALEAETKAKERYEAEKKLFDLGTIDTFRLLQVQDSVSAIRLSIVAARSELATTSTFYLLSIGRIR